MSARERSSWWASLVIASTVDGLSRTDSTSLRSSDGPRLAVPSLISSGTTRAYHDVYVRYTIDFMERRIKRIGWLPLGHARSFWWSVVRSETAQRRKILRDEIAWSGKGLNPDDLDELITEQRPPWRRARSCNA